MLEVLLRGLTLSVNTFSGVKKFLPCVFTVSGEAVIPKECCNSELEVETRPQVNSENVWSNIENNFLFYLILKCLPAAVQTDGSITESLPRI